MAKLRRARVDVCAATRIPTAESMIEAEPEPERQPNFGDYFDPEEPARYCIAIAALRVQREFGLDPSDPAIGPAIVAAVRRQWNDMSPKDWGWTRTSVAQALGDSVVYYMRNGNRVKIGFSTNITARVAAIGPEELMVVEPGGRELEQERHRQFRLLRSHNEWFRLEEPLIAHIEALRDQAVETLTRPT